MTIRFGFVLLLFVTGCISTTSRADQPAPNFETLIDKLQETTADGYGYSSSFSGSAFAPYPNSGQIGMLLLGQAAPTPSAPLEALVRQGVPAVPALLKHLDDARPCKIPPIKGMMWMAFNDEYDYNRRTRNDRPAGVNRNSFSENQPADHTVTVGDLCFVALGQIVNRNFRATRYQPTGGIIVNSPTYSKTLRAVVRHDFDGLTPDQHRQMLFNDFLHPDYEGRRIGAYQRVAFYYPEQVESLVLKQLTVPTFDVFDAEKLVRDQLYPENSPAARKKLFDQFIANRGPAASDGVLHQLFDDLDMQEANEQHRLSPPLGKPYHARELLIELYGYKNKVTRADQPYIDTWARTEEARFIGTLTHDNSSKIDAVVHSIFVENKTDDYLALACINRLLGRGYDDEIRIQCETRAGNDKGYAAVLDKLNALKHNKPAHLDHTAVD